MTKAIAVVLGSLLAVATLVSVSAQPQGVPHFYYGLDGTPGDTIGLWVSHGDHNDQEGEATVDADGGWSIQANVEPEDAIFSVNGEIATADTDTEAEGRTRVSNLTVAASDEDAMGEDAMGEDAMGEDSMGEDAMGEDSMGEDAMGEDSMGDDEESMLDEDANGFPYTGSGGLADNGGISAGLIGLLIAVGAVAITGLGLRRVRNRA